MRTRRPLGVISTVFGLLLLGACGLQAPDPSAGLTADSFPHHSHVRHLSHKRDARTHALQGTQPGAGMRRHSNRHRAPSVTPRWTCGYSATLNHDWHDDVLCTNGVQSRRPYLLPGDPYITVDEILGAARAYERSMNR